MSLQTDTATIESLITAVYDGVSGKRPNWERLRPLFHRDARLVPPARDGVLATAITFEEYQERSLKNVESLPPDQGFYEREIARRVETFGDIAHIWSTYESRRKPDDTAPFARGINSFQFVHLAGRWWVLTILWDAERSDNPIPDKYL